MFPCWIQVLMLCWIEERKNYLQLPDITCASYQNVVRTKLDHFSNSLPLLIFSIKQATYLLSTYYLLSTGKYGSLSWKKSKLAHEYYPYYCFLTLVTVSLGSFLTNMVNITLAVAGVVS